jgi:hypothetical protein
MGVVASLPQQQFQDRAIRKWVIKCDYCRREVRNDDMSTMVVTWWWVWLELNTACHCTCTAPYVVYACSHPRMHDATCESNANIHIDNIYTYPFACNTHAFEHLHIYHACVCMCIYVCICIYVCTHVCTFVVYLRVQVFGACVYLISLAYM